MKTLKELVVEKEKVWLEIKPKDYEGFLEFAKTNHCTWIDGSKKYSLKKFEDHPGFAFMEIDKNGIIGFIPAFCWLKDKTEKFQV